MMYDLKWRKWWKKRAIGKYDQVTEREERKRTQKIQKKKKEWRKIRLPIFVFFQFLAVLAYPLHRIHGYTDNTVVCEDYIRTRNHTYIHTAYRVTVHRII